MVTYYDDDGNVVDEQESVEYGPWVGTGERRRGNPSMYIAPSPNIPLISIPLDKPSSNSSGNSSHAKENDSGQQQDTESGSDNAYGKHYRAEKMRDYSFHSAAKENAPGSSFYTAGVSFSNRDTFIGTPGNTLFDTGDIILAPGVTKEMVLSAGFGWLDKEKGQTVDFVTLSPEQLKKAQLANKPGIVPKEFSFAVVKKLDQYDPIQHFDKDGVYITTYSKLYTELSVYKLDGE